MVRRAFLRQFTLLAIGSVLPFYLLSKKNLNNVLVVSIVPPRNLSFEEMDQESDQWILDRVTYRKTIGDFTSRKELLKVEMSHANGKLEIKYIFSSQRSLIAFVNTIESLHVIDHQKRTGLGYIVSRRIV